MAVRIATFNANNLFSRWSFQAELPRAVANPPVAEVAEVAGDGAADTVGAPSSSRRWSRWSFPDGNRLSGVLRTFRDELVKGVDPKGPGRGSPGVRDVS